MIKKMTGVFKTPVISMFFQLFTTPVFYLKTGLFYPSRDLGQMRRFRKKNCDPIVSVF